MKLIKITFWMRLGEPAATRLGMKGASLKLERSGYLHILPDGTELAIAYGCKARPDGSLEFKSYWVAFNIATGGRWGLLGAIRSMIRGSKPTACLRTPLSTPPLKQLSAAQPNSTLLLNGRHHAHHLRQPETTDR